MSSIAFVGAGPTTLYALNALLSQGVRDTRITVFEADATAGSGSPYRPDWNDPAMLSNIASAEIPPLSNTLLGWLKTRSAAELAEMGVDVTAIDDRAFVPRIVLGRYFQAQLADQVARARGGGNQIAVRTGCRVVDAANRPDGMELTVQSSQGGKTKTMMFDHVVLATGHQWPSRQEPRPGHFVSPWPATALAGLPAVDIGIRGSSLTAIDTAVAVARTHGAFERRDDVLVYEPDPHSDGFGITMMSRKGLLPEADFYFPIPPEPLKICTQTAISALVERGGAGLLDAVFDLFRRELSAEDPAYAAVTRLAGATLEQFAEAYFEARQSVDAFQWAAANLAEARANHAAKVTVPWRDAILRMHEVVAAIVPHLDGPEFARFNQSWKPVFVDAYGAVPHESIERMLALHHAGKLSVLALGDDYRIDTRCAEGGAKLLRGEDSRWFPVFIEATGQRPLGAIQFPFLSLLEQGIVRDEPSDDPSDTSRGIVIDEVFQPVTNGLPADRLFCLSLPFIMGRRPFVQGITSSHEMGEIVGRKLATVLEARASLVDKAEAVA